MKRKGDILSFLDGEDFGINQYFVIGIGAKNEIGGLRNDCDKQISAKIINVYIPLNVHQSIDMQWYIVLCL